MDIFSPVTVLRGVGEAKARAFQRLGISTVYDLLFHFPRAYGWRHPARAPSVSDFPPAFQSQTQSACFHPRRVPPHGE